MVTTLGTLEKMESWMVSTKRCAHSNSSCRPRMSDKMQLLKQNFFLSVAAGRRHLIRHRMRLRISRG
jgi:hypothetical protein